jgi:hypothetical protein
LMHSTEFWCVNNHLSHPQKETFKAVTPFLSENIRRKLKVSAYKIAIDFLFIFTKCITYPIIFRMMCKSVIPSWSF